jgi:hypothetical protein
VEGWVDGGMGGFAKVDNRFGHENGYKGGVRVGFISIHDMYNNDVGMGGVYAHEAYEVK